MITRTYKEMLTVSQLIEQLKDLPEDSLVYMARDEEGNGFRQLEGPQVASVYRTDHHVDNVYSEEELNDQDQWLEDDEMPEVPIVVLW